jgi:hypothetical protein
MKKNTPPPVFFLISPFAHDGIGVSASDRDHFFSHRWLLSHPDSDRQKKEEIHSTRV